MGRKRRAALPTAVATFALTAGIALGLGPGTPASAQSTARPNFIVVMTDDQTLEAMRVLPQTQALIGDAGATFEQFFVSFPLCCPSRASFLTGQYPHNNRVLENYPPAGGFQALDSTETLPVWLNRSGYYTGQIGKLMNGYNTSPVGVPPGLERMARRKDREPLLRLQPARERGPGHLRRPRGRFHRSRRPGVVLDRHLHGQSGRLHRAARRRSRAVLSLALL